MPGFVSERRLYLDKDGNVVEATDPTKATLLVNAGGEIPEERARELGLTTEGVAAEPAATKARPGPAENK